MRQTTKDNANLLSDQIAISQNNFYDITSNYLSSLQLAITNFNLTIIEYQKLDGSETTKRTVEPFAILSTQENWLLVAWCRLRKEFRVFRLDRIKNIQIQNEKFEPHKITLKEYFTLSKK